MSFFTELKRRNVFRVALAYLVASWVLLQVTDVLMQILGLPETTGKFVFLGLVLGFVPALVASWVFEMTPDGLKKDTGVVSGGSNAVQSGQKLDRITMVLAMIAIAVVVVDRLIPKHATAPSSNASAVVAPMETLDSPAEKKVADRTPSLAVLPFTNMSPDPDNEYFADGISEELLNVLVEIEGLRVPSRTSSFAFKGKNTGIRDIANQLEVDYVLEGSVRKASDRVRITAQLIDVTTDTHLWSETYDRKLEDIFAIQDEIARHITEALKVALELEQSRVPTTNLEAYTLFLQGRELLRRREEYLYEADRVLRAAVELDPEFAEAWGALAKVQITIPNYTKIAWTEFLAPTLKFAERALELDPSQADAMLAIGQVMILQGNLMASLEQFEMVTEQHPRDSQARLWYGIALFKAGYAIQAFEQLSIAMDLDPVHSAIIDWFARSAVAAGKSEFVLESAKRAIQLGRQQGRVSLLNQYIVEGPVSDIEPFYVNAPDMDRDMFLHIFELRDDPARLSESLAWADQFERDGAGFIAEYARLFFLTIAGSPDDFFKQINLIHAVDDSIDTHVWIPAAKQHRQDEAMKTWVQGRGYEALWRVRGWPDLCHPIGDNDWACD